MSEANEASSGFDDAPPTNRPDSCCSTVSPNAPHDASQDYAAYVMQDLDFDDDSITDSVYLLRGSTQTITVNDGDWLELFGTVATPPN